MKIILVALTFFASLSSFAEVDSIKPCGLKGSIESRISSCSSHKAGFSLVTRTKEGLEIHQDVRTNLLWSDRLPTTMNQVDASRACAAIKEFAGISGMTWRLPKIKEFIEANKNGIREALPNMNYVFWSSSVYQYEPSLADMFNGYTGFFYDYDRDNKISVRCIAQ